MKLKKIIYRFNLPFEINNKLIEDGLIKINDKVITNKDYEVLENDLIEIKEIKFNFKYLINLVINKPKNYLSARKDKEKKCVIELLKKPYSYYKFTIAGRLDYNTTGLLILTTSGRFANKICNPIYKIEKTYRATLDRTFDKTDLEKIKLPMVLLDGKFQKYTSKVVDAKIINNNVVEIILNTGKYHQVKNIFKHLNYEVIELERIKVGNLTLKNLKEKEVYEFKEEDIF